MESDFLLAVETGDLDSFKSLVAGGSSILSNLTPHGNTILHIVLMCGHEELAREICSFDDGYQLIWKANKKGETPLHYAAATSDYGVLFWAEDVLSRLKSSDNVVELLKAKDVEGNTALSIAAAGGHANLVRLMLEIDGDLSMDVNNDGESALYRAALGGRGKVVSLLLSCPSPSGGCRGPCGRTVLHAAVRNGDSEMVLMIVKAMPQQTDEADDFGCTPLHYAVYSGDPEIVFHLVQNSSSAAYSLNNKGRSPLHEAAAMGLMEAVEVMVFHCRDSTEVLDSTGKNALHIAVESGQQEIIKYLLSKNDKLINQRDADGNTPLHIASLKSDSDALFTLVENEAVNLYAENRIGQTFVDMAATKPTADNFFKMQRFHSILTAAFVLKPTLSKSLTSKYMETIKTSARLLYDWRMDKISIIATLIATVTFAAGLTAPGGFVNGGPDEGSPTLARASAFKAFMVFDTLGLFFSLVLIAFASIKAELIEKHIIKFVLLTGLFVDFSLTSVALAFGTGVYTFLSHQSRSLAIFLCILCCAMLMLIWAPNMAVSYWSSYKASHVIGWNLGRNYWALKHPETQQDVSPQTVILI